MPITDTVRGVKRTLTLADVKQRLTAGSRSFDGLPEAERRYIESAAAGDVDVAYRDLTERVFFTPKLTHSLPVIGSLVEYRLELGKSVSHPGARVRSGPTETQKYVETHELMIEATYKIRIRPFSGTWQIGFFQTVDSLERSVSYSDRVQPRVHRPATEIRTFIDAPVRDATANVADDAPPWYDKSAVKDITSEFASGDVRLRDYPGMLIDWTHAQHKISLDARQSFTTYLVLRRSTGFGNALADAAGACVILARWKWSSWFKLEPPSQEPTGGYDFASLEELPDSAAIPAIPNSPVGKELLATNQTQRRV